MDFARIFDGRVRLLEEHTPDHLKDAIELRARASRMFDGASEGDVARVAAEVVKRRAERDKPRVGKPSDNGRPAPPRKPNPLRSVAKKVRARLREYLESEPDPDFDEALEICREINPDLKWPNFQQNYWAKAREEMGVPDPGLRTKRGPAAPPSVVEARGATEAAQDALPDHASDKPPGPAPSEPTPVLDGPSSGEWVLELATPDGSELAARPLGHDEWEVEFSGVVDRFHLQRLLNHLTADVGRWE